MQKGILERMGYREGELNLVIRMDGAEAARLQLAVMMAHVDGGMTHPTVELHIKAAAERCAVLVPKPEIIAAGVMPRPMADYQPCGAEMPCALHRTKKKGAKK